MHCPEKRRKQWKWTRGQQATDSSESLGPGNQKNLGAKGVTLGYSQITEG